MVNTEESVVYLERQVGDQAGHPEAHQQQVCEDKGSGGVADLLDLPITLLWLGEVSENRKETQEN